MSATVTFPEVRAAGEPDGEPAQPARLDPRWVTVAAGVLAVTAVLAIVGRGAIRYPSFTDDEGTYTAQSWAVLAHHTLSHYTYWYDHPPLGWVQLAFGTWIFGPLIRLLAPGATAVGRARVLMVGIAGVTAALVFLWSRRLGMRRSTAVAATLLFGVSPLSVALVRQVYLDNVSAPWLIGAFVLAATPARRLWAFSASGACLAVAVLSKETSVLLLPAVAFAVWRSSDPKTRPFCLTAFTSTLVLIGAGYPLLAALKGELLPGARHVSLWSGIAFQLWQRASTGSVLGGRSVSHQVLSQWLHTDPWLLGAGVASIPAGLLVPRLRPAAIGLVTLVLAAIRPGYLPQMFVIAALPFCAVLVAGWADELLDHVAGWAVRGTTVAAAVALLAVALIVADRWKIADRTATTYDAAAPQVAAERWVATHISRRSRVLVDDSFYVDLVEAGFQPRLGVVWFYKLDFTNNRDPSVERALPRGYAEFDYVISTPVIRTALTQNPGGLQQVRLALSASRPVATFGSGDQAVEVRRLSPGRGARA